VHSTAAKATPPGDRTHQAAAEHVTQAERTGPHDTLPLEDVLTLFSALPFWGQGRRDAQALRLRGARTILTWLATFPGSGWQQRWCISGADAGKEWIDELTADDPRSARQKRSEIHHGLACLLACQVILPGYSFITAYTPLALYDNIRATISPDALARAAAAAVELGVTHRPRKEALLILVKIVMHTGKDLDQLTETDVHAFRDWHFAREGRTKFGLHAAWDMLVEIDVLPTGTSLRRSCRQGQHPTAHLVDRYQITCRPVRDLLVRYLGERRPSMDYASLASLATLLARTFWADIEQHHPGIDTIDLPEDVFLAWKGRLRFVTRPDGTRRERKTYIDNLIRIRSFYLDVQEWALQDPSWAPWAVPCPIRKGDTVGLLKARKKVIAEIHQRIRERLPHLPALVECAEQHRRHHTDLLHTAAAIPLDVLFEHAGTTYRRTARKSYTYGWASAPPPETVVVEDTDTGELTDLTKTEEEAFWSWAVIETLRLTGVRIEELLEITHLALVSYTLSDTGETVPLLQIIPSKTDQERLLLVTPELASVLAQVITRVRGKDGRVPLVSRYDEHERTAGPPLPHLFQRKYGWRSGVMSTTAVQNLITATIDRAGLVDQTGQPLRYTPHDFRRMFATEAVTGGLPVHIAARILGHSSLTTTQTYLAVFQDDLIRSYRAFVDQRRATRPTGEYREPTDEEWAEFQQHFELRKLELGTCGRPYGTPCKHEHACIRCPSLRLDEHARPRLVEIIANLRDRINEARMNGWLGEVQGLQVSLNEATRKLVGMDRTRDRQAADPVDLPMPEITTRPRS
jgi:integrase